MLSKRPVVSSLCSFTAVLLAVHRAGRTGCPNAIGEMDTFSGDQSSGVLIGTDFSSPPITQVSVEALTTDIAPVSSAGVG